MENTTLPVFTPNSLDYFGIHPTIFVFYTVFLFIGIPGNILVLYVYTKCFKNIFGLFVRTLAILDLTNLIGYAPTYLISKLIPQLNSPSLCKFILQAQNFNLSVTGLLYVTIAIQRYKQICHPHSNQIRESCAKKLVLGCIALSLMFGLPIQFIVTNVYLSVKIEISNETFLMKVPKCDFTNDSKESKSALAFTAWLFILIGSIVMSLMVLYILIGRHIHNHKSNVTGLSHENRSRMSTMTKVFGVLTAFFLITITPRIGLAFYFKEKKQLPLMKWSQIQVIDLLTQIPYLNCIVNPFIYGFCSRRFRNKVRAIFCQNEIQQANETGGTITNL